MGYPVNSFEQMECQLRMQQSTRKTNLAMVIPCNARSNSNAAKIIFNNFNILDIVSNEINFFLPGYETINPHCTSDLQQINDHIKYLKGLCQNEYNDYHYNYPFDIVMSRRLGPILFNDASFANFVKELSLKCNVYNYSGSSELILLPLKNGEPIYNELHSLPLDPLCTNNRMSLDTFFHKTFNILREERLSPLSIFRYKSNKILNEIFDLYQSATAIEDVESYARQLKHSIDSDILKHMRWSPNDHYFFISYSSEDILEAIALRNSLEQEDLKVWIAPDGIPQGRDYISVIPASIRMASRFILLLSHSSARSTWVRNEISRAISCGTKINVLLVKGYDISYIRDNEAISFMLDGCQIKYRLEEILYDNNIFREFINDRGY